MKVSALLFATLPKRLGDFIKFRLLSDNLEERAADKARLGETPALSTTFARRIREAFPCFDVLRQPRSILRGNLRHPSQVHVIFQIGELNLPGRQVSL